METRKTGSTNDRQDLLAEMLGVMARLRAAEEPSPADAEPRRDAGSKGPAGEHDHVQARQGGQATVPPRKGANPDLQGDTRPVHQGRLACLSERLSVLQDPRLLPLVRSAAFRR